MKLVCWNLDGLSQRIEQDFLARFDNFDADFFCITGTAVEQNQLRLDLPGYWQYWLWADESHDGAAVFTKFEPEGQTVTGDAIILEFREFCLLCGNSNSQRAPFGKPTITCDADGIHLSQALEASVYRRSEHTTIPVPHPVSVDMDLSCNGSILSPTSIGKARIVAPAEEQNSEQTGPTHPKRWTFVAITALVLTLCALLLLPGKPAELPPVTIPGELVPIQIKQLSMVPVCYDSISTSMTPSADAQGNSMLLVGDMINSSSVSETDLLVYTDSYPVSDLEQATFCVRADLTQEATDLAQDGWVFRVTTETGLSSKPYAYIDNLHVIAYYSDSTRSSIAGWFIFGDARKDFCLAIEVRRYDTDYLYRDFPVFTPKISVPTPEQPFIAEWFLDIPVALNDDPRTGNFEDYQDIYCFLLDDVYFSYGNFRDVFPENISYFILVKPDPVLLEELGGWNLEFHASRPDQTTDRTVLQFRSPYVASIYSNDDLTQPVAWIVYDDYPLLNDLKLSLSWWSSAEKVTYEIPFHFPTAVSGEQAAEMTTAELIRAIVHNPRLCDLLADTEDGTVPDDPAIYSLVSREDAVAQLLRYSPVGQTGNQALAPYYLLRTDLLKDRMTPAQTVTYLLGGYPGAPEPYEYSCQSEGEFTTQELIGMLHEDTKLWQYLTTTDDPGIRSLIYYRLRQTSNLLPMLEWREDAEALMQDHSSHCEECSVHLLLNMWSWIKEIDKPVEESST